MANLWHYKRQGQSFGPFSDRQLKQLATSGQLQSSDMVQREGAAQWVVAGRVKGLFAVAVAKPPATEMPPPLPPGDVADTPTASWYYGREGQRSGPISDAQLWQLAKSGELLPTDVVWKKGLAQWVRAAEIKGLFPPTPKPAQLPSSGLVGPDSPTQSRSLPEGQESGLDIESVTASYRRLPTRQRRDVFTVQRIIIGTVLIAGLLVVAGIAATVSRRAWATDEAEHNSAGTAPSIPALTKMLEQKERNNQMEVAQAVRTGEAPFKPDIQAVINRVAENDAVIRKNLARQYIANSVALNVETPKQQVATVKQRAMALSHQDGQLTYKGQSLQEWLTQAIRHRTLEKRIEATKALGRMGAEAVPALVVVLRTNGSEVHSALSYAFRRNGPAAVPALIDVLHDRDVEARHEAIEMLKWMGPDAKAAIPDLVELLGDDEMTRYQRSHSRGLIWYDAETALMEIGVVAVPALTELLENEQQVGSIPWRNAAYALMHLGPEARKVAIPAVREGYRKAKPGVRGRIAQLWNDVVTKETSAEELRELGINVKEVDVAALVQALSDKKANKRCEAANALSRIGPKAKGSIPILIQALNDGPPFVQIAAATALGSIGPEAREAIPALRQSLGKEGSRVRGDAAKALGQIGSEAKAAIPDIIQLLGDKDDYVREAAANGLFHFGPDAKAAIPALERVLRLRRGGCREWPPTVSSIAARALGNIGPDATMAVPALTQLLQYYPYESAWALGKMGLGAKISVPTLIDTLHAGEHCNTDPDAENAGWLPIVVQALGNVGPEAKQAVPALAELLEYYPYVQVHAIKALGNIGPEARMTIPALTELCNDCHSYIQKAAIEALAKINSEEKR